MLAAPRINTELYIDFDGRQLTVRTDVGELHDYLTRTFRHMLVPRVAASAGSLEFLRTTDGYSLRSARFTDFPGTPLADVLPVVKDEVRLQFMRGRPDLLWLHAGAVERDGGALLLSGSSGQGKSTLTTQLCELGWRLLSDDIAPIRMDADTVLPFPQAPVRRVYPGWEVAAGEVGMLRREIVSVAPEMLCRSEAQIRALVFIAYSNGGTVQLTRLPQGSGAMEILRNSTNFVDHKEAAVDRAADIARRFPIYRLSYGSAADAAPAVTEL